MRIIIGFVLGMVVCGLLLFGAKTVLPIRAQTDNTSGTSGNVTQGLLDLIPDIGRIYRESLTMPFRMAESEIYDEDIAEFYGALLDKTGLRSAGDELGQAAFQEKAEAAFLSSLHSTRLTGLELNSPSVITTALGLCSAD
jgi:hypothetical protein